MSSSRIHLAAAAICHCSSGSVDGWIPCDWSFAFRAQVGSAIVAISKSLNIVLLRDARLDKRESIPFELVREFDMHDRHPPSATHP